MCVWIIVLELGILRHIFNKYIFVGIPERNKICKSILIIVKPFSGCSGEVENNISQANLVSPMVVSGDSLKHISVIYLHHADHLRKKCGDFFVADKLETVHVQC